MYFRSGRLAYRWRYLKSLSIKSPARDILFLMLHSSSSRVLSTSSPGSVSRGRQALSIIPHMLTLVTSVRAMLSFQGVRYDSQVVIAVGAGDQVAKMSIFIPQPIESVIPMRSAKYFEENCVPCGLSSIGLDSFPAEVMGNDLHRM